MNLPTNLLLVEDNLGDIGLVQAALQMGESPEVQMSAVHTATEALRFIARTGPYSQVGRPDLIVLDLNLPGMKGMELLISLKRHEEWRTIPVVILTSSQREDDREQCLAAGAVAFWNKPVAWSDFTAFASDLRRCLTTGVFTDTAASAPSAA